MKTGQKIKGKCVACGKPEIWKIESITNEKYSNGMFKTYNLQAVKNCISNTVKTSLKDCPEVWQQYKKIK